MAADVSTGKQSSKQFINLRFTARYVTKAYSLMLINLNKILELQITNRFNTLDNKSVLHLLAIATITKTKVDS